MDNILLFIPVYNCEKQVDRVLSKLDDDVFDYIRQVIVVNNLSSDNTEQIVREFVAKHPQKPIRLIRNDSNYNLGGSHKVAFQYAIQNGFDYVVVLHGDDQGDIRDLLPLLKEGKHTKYDCCLGARFKQGGRLIGYSKFRTFGNVVFNMIFSVMLFKPIYDLGAGLNLYCTKMLKNNFYHKFPDTLSFNYCMIMAASYYRHNVLFFPISWREEDQVSNVKMTSQAMNVLGMLFKYFLNKKKFIGSELRSTPVEQYTGKDVTEM